MVNMRRILASCLIALCLVANTGCSSLMSQGSNSGMTGEGGRDISQLTDEELALANRARWGEGSIPNAEADGLFKDIHFKYDSAVVPAEYHEVLKKNAQFLINDPSLKADIEGHCDERGTNEYNLALGEERARAVAGMMVNYGVSPESLRTISYGEEIPIDSASNDAAYAKNRRVHFALFRK